MVVEPLEPLTRRCRGDRGVTMQMTAVFLVTVMVGLWAVLSATQAWTIRRDVTAAANAAARAGAQPSLSEASASEVHLDPARAASRAQSVIDSSGYQATVRVHGETVSVTVSAPIDYAFPAPGFPASLTVTGSATAQQGANS